jgi:DNA-binding NarL/FixJ family response regulator
MFRIVIATTDDILTRRLRICLGRTEGLDVVGGAHHADATLELTCRVQPHVVILDTDPEGCGLIAPLKRLVPSILIVAVTDDPNYPVNGSVDPDVVALLVPDAEAPGGLKVIPPARDPEAVLPT